MKDQTTPNLCTDIFSVLKERIIRWDYPPSHRFTEEGLCDEFGVSRSPVREALRMLVENGLADKEPHRGFSVKQPDMQEIDELYDVRLALELHVVEHLGARGMPINEWEKLNNTWQIILDNLPQTITDFAAKDEEFHETLAACTGNRALLQLLQNIDERLHFVRMTDITTAERLRATCEQHLKILVCIKYSTADCARESLRLNIEGGHSNVEHAIKEALARSYMGHRSDA